MSAAFVSALVAGVAVVVSGVMQFLTLKRSRENTLLTLQEGRHTARMTALATTTEQWEAGLRDDLAEFATLTYNVEAGYRDAMSQGLPWPGEKAELVNKVDLLYGRVLLRLDPRVAEEISLRQALEALMRTDADELWIVRRDAVIQAARHAISLRYDQVFGRPNAPQLPR